MSSESFLPAFLLEAGKTQADLARDLSVGRAVVHAWITRGRIPAERLSDVVRVLKLDASRARRLYAANGLELPAVLCGEAA